MLDPDSKVQYLKGVGPHWAELFQRLGAETVRDLLYLFPHRYEDLTARRKIRELTAGERGTVVGRITDARRRQTRRGDPIHEVLLEDDTGALVLTWFNARYLDDQFPVGQYLAASGQVKQYRSALQMTNPRFQAVDDDAGESLDLSLIPIHPLTEDLKGSHVRGVMRRALEACADSVAETLPAALREEHGLCDLQTALWQMHFPKTWEEQRRARVRHVYEEFLVLQLALALRRRQVTTEQTAPELPVSKQLDTRIRRLFPFEFTPGQNRAVAEIAADLAKTQPMNRLLQGDVGCGKTVVALYALLTAIRHRYQAALMAPTEVLASQHFQAVEAYLAHSRVRRCLLTGGLSAAQRKRALADIAAGEVDLVVGTQALIQSDVQFARLAVVVIDEQHKFGVRQRAALQDQQLSPHYLVMTATPIPRSLMLTVFGDLDTTIIEDMPAGRQPIETHVVLPRSRSRVHATLRREFQHGRQAYVIYPLVEESAVLDLQSAVDGAEQLAQEFPEFTVGLVHGRMSEREKADAMDRFRAGEIQMLVSTLVVEVGVDVPNATIMVVEHAERFGLSQLHQLRGRIGRGEHQGYCLLISDPTNETARDRLKAIAATTNGFKIAEEDLRLRGPGEFFGTRQHGLPELKVGHIINDYDWLKLARRDAAAMLQQDPALASPEHAVLRQLVHDRYGQSLALISAG